METSKFKIFLTHKSIQKAEHTNLLSGKFEYEEINVPVTEWNKSGKSTLRKFVPYTDSDIWAKHKICVHLPHSLYMWFSVFKPTPKQPGYYYSLDHVWKGGPGKKMRKDAAWNLCYKMMEDMKLNEMPY